MELVGWSHSSTTSQSAPDSGTFGDLCVYNTSSIKSAECLVARQPAGKGVVVFSEFAAVAAVLCVELAAAVFVENSRNRRRNEPASVGTQ